MSLSDRQVTSPATAANPLSLGPRSRCRSLPCIAEPNPCLSACPWLSPICSDEHPYGGTTRTPAWWSMSGTSTDVLRMLQVSFPESSPTFPDQCTPSAQFPRFARMHRMPTPFDCFTDQITLSNVKARQNVKRHM